MCIIIQEMTHQTLVQSLNQPHVKSQGQGKTQNLCVFVGITPMKTLFKVVIWPKINISVPFIQPLNINLNIRFQLGKQ
jgi:hypothetical protein